MDDPRERLSRSISADELERRWNAVREIMREEKVDFLLMRNDEEFLGGYVRWFTDIPARHSYPTTVIFPIDEEMTLINCGPFPPGEPPPPPWAVRGVKNRLSAPYFPSVHYTYKYDAELAVSVLKAKKSPTIGLVGRSFIPTNFFEYLSTHLQGARFVEMTDQIDQIKAVKSPEEIELIKECAALQDSAIEHVKRQIRPGRRTFEIHAEAQYSVMMQGSERQLILVNSGPQGTPVPFAFRRFQNRVLKEGDQVSLLIEVNGPGGFYTEIARIFTIGEPSAELQEAHAAAVEAQEQALSLLKPGADPGELLEANNNFLVKRGYQEERRLFAHGQGYDLVERPVMLRDETMNIKAGNNITVHPAACNDRVWATVCDNYIITEDGPSPCLHKTPKEIIVV
ncbi:MAG: aminopeptidase P family protein [Deltaproteobacteria bacterium]|nr:aminopeptidase P family protein [Deltaproteobacteria bacterium]MBW2138314.1 aminopeptidase P family protein [Deltaproteobacteria bacterium]